MCVRAGELVLVFTYIFDIWNDALFYQEQAKKRKYILMPTPLLQAAKHQSKHKREGRGSLASAVPPGLDVLVCHPHQTFWLNINSNTKYKQEGRGSPASAEPPGLDVLGWSSPPPAAPLRLAPAPMPSSSSSSAASTSQRDAMPTHTCMHTGLCAGLARIRCIVQIRCFQPEFWQFSNWVVLCG